MATGVVTTLAGTAGSTGAADGTGAAARFNRPTGIEFDGSSNLYLGEVGNHTIRKIVIATGVVTTFAGTVGVSGTADGTGTAASFNRPEDIAFDTSGNMYVADSLNNTIRKIVIATGVVTTFVGRAATGGTANGTGTAARFSSPRGLAINSAGYLFVTDFSNNTIRQVT
jgi:hypothetical protein